MLGLTGDRNEDSTEHLCSIGFWIGYQPIGMLRTGGDPAPSKWMSALPGSKAIASLTIRAPHNSCALYEPVKGTAACQQMSIEKQLESGVRFFDIRCRHEGDLFSIYHGPVFQKQDFTGWLIG